MNKLIRQTIFLTIFLILSGAAALGQAGRSRNEPLKVGDVAPAFTLSDQDGKNVTLAKTGHPVVLVFYRGFW